MTGHTWTTFLFKLTHTMAHISMLMWITFIISWLHLNWSRINFYLGTSCKFWPHGSIKHPWKCHLINELSQRPLSYPPPFPRVSHKHLRNQWIKNKDKFQQNKVSWQANPIILMDMIVPCWLNPLIFCRIVRFCSNKSKKFQLSILRFFIQWPGVPYCL